LPPPRANRCLRRSVAADYSEGVSARGDQLPSPMPGEGEARALLRTLLERLGQDARRVLGVGTDCTPAQARAAFLALTKRYHPTKFARFAPDVVKLANEVFLGIKRAYESIERPAPPPAAPTPAPPTVAPPAPAPAPHGTPRMGTPVPHQRSRMPRITLPTGGTARTRRGTSPALELGPHPAAGPGPAARAKTPTSPLPRPPAPAPAPALETQRIVRMRESTEPGVPGAPPPGAPSSPPVPASSSNAIPTPMARISTERMPALGARPAAAPAAPAATGTARTPTTPATPTGSSSRIPRLDHAEEPAQFERGLELLRRRLWTEAEKVFAQLAITVPSDKRYRAHRHYARGRIAQDLGRHDDARSEWERALSLEPSLLAAKVAMDQLPEPEPPKPNGLLSKLFRR